MCNDLNIWINLLIGITWDFNQQVDSTSDHKSSALPLSYTDTWSVVQKILRSLTKHLAREYRGKTTSQMFMPSNLSSWRVGRAHTHTHTYIPSKKICQWINMHPSQAGHWCQTWLNETNFISLLNATHTLHENSCSILLSHHLFIWPWLLDQPMRLNVLHFLQNTEIVRETYILHTHTLNFSMDTISISLWIAKVLIFLLKFVLKLLLESF